MHTCIDTYTYTNRVTVRETNMFLHSIIHILKHTQTHYHTHTHTNTNTYTHITVTNFHTQTYTPLDSIIYTNTHTTDTH